jgi:hypothetical protein
MEGTMKPKRMILLLLAVAAVAVAIAPALVSASADDVGSEQAPAAEAASSEQVQEPVETTDGPPRLDYCTVSRNCAYPPPSSISCTSYLNDCDEGSEGYGWVECDGQRTYCSGPSCGGTGTPCSKDSHCYTPGVCTCGAGVCTNGACVCPENPDP